MNDKPEMILTDAVRPLFDLVKKAFESGDLNDQILAVHGTYWAGFNRCCEEVEDEQGQIFGQINPN